MMPDSAKNKPERQGLVGALGELDRRQRIFLARITTEIRMTEGQDTGT
jgi:hypothetical protein